MKPPAPLRKFAPDVPPKLLAVIDRGLQRAPAARFQSAAEMSASLRGMPGEPIRLEPRTDERRTATMPVPVQSRSRPAPNGNGNGAGHASAAPASPRAPDRHRPPRTPSPQQRRSAGHGATATRSGRRAGAPPGRPRSGAPGRPAPLPVHYRRRRALVGLLAVILVAIVVLFGLSPTRTADQSNAPSPVAAAVAVTPTSVKDVDPRPRGDGSESPLQTQAAVDGDADSKWSTDKYNSPQDFTGLKEGVGLAFEFDQPVAPSTITALVSPDTTFEWRTSADGDTDNPGSWEPVPGTESTAEGRSPVEVTADVGGRSARYWLLWITGVGRVSGGRGQSSVYEVRFGSGG